MSDGRPIDDITDIDDIASSDAAGGTDDAMAALVDRALRRDADTWEHIYRTRHRALFGFANRRLLDARLAEDAVSETMTRALTAIDRFTWRAGGFDAWLFGIARNVVLEMGRASMRPVDPTVADQRADTAAAPEDAVTAVAERRIVRDAFARLDPDERELLELRVCADLSSDDVGLLLGKQPGTIRMAQSRALQRLRTFVEEVDREG